MENITITNEITDSQKLEVCELFYEGFYKKLSNFWIFEKDIKKGVHVLNDCINFENGIYVIENDKVIGFTGLVYNNTSFKEFNKYTLNNHYDFFNRSIRVLFNKFENKSKNLKSDEMYIDIIVVDKNSRGRGIASLLINKVHEFSINNNYNKILLDVVDTNENAIRLYEHLGFNVMKKTNFRGITDSMGFRNVYYMSKDINKIY